MGHLLAVLILSFSLCAEDSLRTDSLRELITEARSPSTNLTDKEKVAQLVLSHLRQMVASEFKSLGVEEFNQKVLQDPQKLATFLKTKEQQDLFTEFSSLVSQITIESKLKSCSDYKGIKEGLSEGAASYNPCKEGIYAHHYTTWESKTPGDLKVTEHSIPNFLYSKNLDDLLKVANNYHSDYGVESNPPLLLSVEGLRKIYPGLKDAELVTKYSSMKLQSDAYQRAVFNAAKNALTAQIQYNSPSGPVTDVQGKANLTVEKICLHCSKESITRLQKKLSFVMKEDLLSGRVRPKKPTDVARDICQKLRELKYPFVSSLSSRDLSPTSFFLGKGQVKLNSDQTKRINILTAMAQGGGDQLLLLTEGLTVLDEKEPAQIKLKCRSGSEKADAELIKLAGTEASNHALEYIHKINQDLVLDGKSAGVEKNLQLLLKTNPRAIGEALNQDSNGAALSCELISAAKSDDRAQDFKDQQLIWGSAIVGGGLTLTGILAPVGTGIGLLAIASGTALGVSSAVVEWQNADEARERSELYEAAVFASGNPRLSAISHEEYQRFQAAKISAMINFGLSSLDVLANVKVLMKAGRSLYQALDMVDKFKPLKKRPPYNLSHVLKADDLSRKQLDELGVVYSQTKKDSFLKFTSDPTIPKIPDANAYGYVYEVDDLPPVVKKSGPESPALTHPEMEEAKENLRRMGYRLMVDSSLKPSNVGPYTLHMKQSRGGYVALKADTPWSTFAHEYQHVVFNDSLGGAIYRGKLWGKDNISGYLIQNGVTAEKAKRIEELLKLELTNVSLDETLAVDEQLNLLGWKRHWPLSGMSSKKYALRHQIHEFEKLPSLTSVQKQSLKQAKDQYLTHELQELRYGLLRPGAELGAIGGAAYYLDPPEKEALTVDKINEEYQQILIKDKLMIGLRHDGTWVTIEEDKAATTKK